MNTLIPSNIAEALGWTILHSLWQASIIGAVLILLLKITKSTQANQRYLLSLAALFSILLTAVITFFAIYQPHNQVVPSDLSEEIAWLYFPTFQESKETWEDYISVGISMANKYSYELSLLWLIGVVFLSIRFLINLLYIHQLKTYKIKPASIEWEGRLRTIAEKINIHRQIKLVESALVQVPTVVGWLKPVILFPLGMFTALPPHEIESILSHELAHIRRNDFIINILQSIVEILFFYHPVVWYISKHIENERENCCDDIAIAVTGDSLTYIKALTNLASVKINTLTPALAVTGKNGSLLQRISRIAHNTNLVNGWARQHAISPKLTAAMIVIMSLLLLVTNTEATTFLIEKLEKTPLEFLVKPFEKERENSVEKDLSRSDTTKKSNKMQKTVKVYFDSLLNEDTITAIKTIITKDSKIDTLYNIVNQSNMPFYYEFSDKNLRKGFLLNTKGDTLGNGSLFISPSMYKLKIPFDKFEIDTIESKNGVCTYKIKGFDSLNASWSWLHDGNSLTAVPTLKKMTKVQIDSLFKKYKTQQFNKSTYVYTDRNLKVSIDSLSKFYFYQALSDSIKKIWKWKSNQNRQKIFRIDSLNREQGVAILKEQRGIILGNINKIQRVNDVSPLYVIDDEAIPQGKEASKEILKKLKPNEIASISILKDEKAFKKYGEKGKNGVILIKTQKGKKKKSDTSDNWVEKKEEIQPQNFSIRTPNSPIYLNDDYFLFVVDGEVIEKNKSNEVLKNLNPNDIVSMSLLKRESAILIYGERGKEGVILISTKKGVAKSGTIKNANETTIDKDTEVRIYPNPAQNYVSIGFVFEKETQVWVEVHNIAGQKIQTIIDGSYLNKESMYVWDTSKVPAGNYIINIRRGDKVSYHKLILE